MTLPHSSATTEGPPTWWEAVTLPALPGLWRTPEAVFVGLVWLLLTTAQLAVTLSRPKMYVPLTHGGQDIPTWAATTTSVCNGLVLAVCLGFVLTRLRPVEPRRLPWLVLVLAPWVVVVGRLVMLDRAPGALAVVYPALAVTVWFLRPRLAVVEVLGYLTAATAAISVALGALVPSAGILVRAAGAEAEKPIGPFGILAGVMLSGNDLAVLLVVGLAGVLTIRNGLHRVVALAVTLVAIGWTFSRTTWYAVVVVLGLAVLLRWVRRSTSDPARWVARLAGVALGGLALLAVAVPLLTPDGTGFNHRAHYWHFALERVREQPWLGLGADFFKWLAGQPDNLGGHASDAHDFMVQILVSGGVVLLACVVALLGVAAVRAVRLARTGMDWAVLFLAGMLAVSVLEVPLTFDDRLREFPHVAVPLLILVLARPLVVAPTDPEGRHEPGQGVERSSAARSALP